MSQRLLNIKDEVEEAYGNELNLLGHFFRVIKICHEEWKFLFIICEFSFGIWISFACPLHDERTLTLLVSQF